MMIIKNNRNFAKKFQLKPSKVKDLKKIYFKIKRNIDSGLTSVFDIKINQSDNVNKNIEEKFYNVKNSQELKSLVKRILNN